jgi:hypothetical protein
MRRDSDCRMKYKFQRSGCGLDGNRIHSPEGVSEKFPEFSVLCYCRNETIKFINGAEGKDWHRECISAKQ